MKTLKEHAGIIAVVSVIMFVGTVLPKLIAPDQCHEVTFLLVVMTCIVGPIVVGPIVTLLFNRIDRAVGGINPWWSILWIVAWLGWYAYEFIVLYFCL